jgi:hypothetical protein
MLLLMKMVNLVAVQLVIRLDQRSVLEPGIEVELGGIQSFAQSLLLLLKKWLVFVSGYVLAISLDMIRASVIHYTTS